MIEHGIFMYTNDNKKKSEILPKFVTNSADGTEEIALMLTSSQETKQNWYIIFVVLLFPYSQLIFLVRNVINNNVK